MVPADGAAWIDGFDFNGLFDPVVIDMKDRTVGLVHADNVVFGIIGIAVDLSVKADAFDYTVKGVVCQAVGFVVGVGDALDTAFQVVAELYLVIVRIDLFNEFMVILVIEALLISQGICDGAYIVFRVIGIGGAAVWDSRRPLRSYSWRVSWPRGSVSRSRRFQGRIGGACHCRGGRFSGSGDRSDAR